MVPVPIPADYQLAPFQRRLTMGPPKHDPTGGTIAPVDVIVEQVDDGQGKYFRFRVLMEVEPADWQRWGVEPPEQPARCWMVQLTTQMVPFALMADQPVGGVA